MIKAFNHVGISVANLELSIAFYRDLFGMEAGVTSTFGDKPYNDQFDAVLGLNKARGKVASLRLGNFGLELFEFHAPEPKAGDPGRPVCDRGITHFSVEVTDIHAVYERFLVAGVAFHCPPQHFKGMGKATYGRDPDGNVFELLEMPGDPGIGRRE